MDTEDQKVEQDGEWVDVAHDPEADLDEDDIKVKFAVLKLIRILDVKAKVE